MFFHDSRDTSRQQRFALDDGAQYTLKKLQITMESWENVGRKNALAREKMMSIRRYSNEQIKEEKKRKGEKWKRFSLFLFLLLFDL